jgi:hypothetical protein
MAASGSSNRLAISCPSSSVIPVAVRSDVVWIDADAETHHPAPVPRIGFQPRSPLPRP